jgi:urea transporter
MNIVQILIAAAVTATVMTVMSEGLDRWERVALNLGTFFLTLFIVKLIQKARAEK